jgi:cytidylate kinase
MTLNYQNIAISGAVASGKGTLKNNLKSYLSPLGWKFTSGGELNRSKSGDYTSPSADKVSDEFNNYIEKRTEELFTKEKHYVIEAWLAGWVARNMDDTLRVLLVCSNPAVTIDRVVNRDKVTVSEAKDIIRSRVTTNAQTWNRLYGEYDFQDPNYFQLVIDTYTTSKQETVQKVLNALGYH